MPRRRPAAVPAGRCLREVSPRQILLRGLVAGSLAALTGIGLLMGYVAWYTGTDRILPGVTVGHTQVGGLRPAEARQRLTGAEVRHPPVLSGGAGAGSGRPVGGGQALAPERLTADPALEAGPSRLVWGDHSWQLDRGAAGAAPDVQEALRAAHALGRSGPMWHRTRQFLASVVHGQYVSLEPRLNDEALARQLEAIAAEIDKPAMDAAYRFESDTVTPEAAGRMLDIPATVAAVQQAVRQRRVDVALVVKTLEPHVRQVDLTNARRHTIATFTTPILAADTGRVQNIAMAVRKISGVALRPGQVFSFNDVVGPRDKEHGWAQAKELYQGEFVLGYGGGICQVSSTLYNSVLLAGLEVAERYHHDRPLQYVDPGRDATVAWKVLDFRFRNNTGMTMLIGARIVPGTPQQIEVTLYGPQAPTADAISLEATDVRYLPPDLEEIPDPTLPPDEREVVDEGHYGIEVSIYRVFRDGGKERRELVSRDTYQPKAGKVKVGVGNAPGSERLLQPGLR